MRGCLERCPYRLPGIAVGAGFAVTRVVLPIAFTLVFGLVADTLRPKHAPAAAGAEPKACGCDSGCGCAAVDAGATAVLSSVAVLALRRRRTRGGTR